MCRLVIAVAIMASLCPNFQGMVTSQKCPEGFDKWLVEQGLLTASDFATLCDSQAGCDAAIIAPAESDKIVFKPLSYKVAIKKLWQGV